MEQISIGNRLVGGGAPCFVIAEIGSNHDGSLDHAFDYIDLAAELGADAVKFQSYCTDRLVNRRWPNGNGGTVATPFISTLLRLELPVEWHEPLAKRARKRGLVFLSTPFDEERADLLAGVGVPAFKIASGDLTHEPLLAHVASYRLPLIISTGLATMEEIERAVEVVEQAAGWKRPGESEIVLLHCVSTYPASPEALQLRAIEALGARFGLPVGLSDHSESVVSAVAAVALGASVIEKHLTFSRDSCGPDHPFAMTPREFGTMVRYIREVEGSLGKAVKEPRQEEVAERVWARRSLFAARRIQAGSRITREMVKIVRPCIGLEPRHLEAVLGSVARCAIPAHEPIVGSALEMNNGSLSE